MTYVFNKTGANEHKIAKPVLPRHDVQQKGGDGKQYDAGKKSEVSGMKRYRVVNNGVSCLVEPCFSWDITEAESGDKKAVSGVARGTLGAGAIDNKMMDDIMTGKVYVHGYFEPYTVDKPVSGEGIRFVVTDIIGSVD